MEFGRSETTYKKELCGLLFGAIFLFLFISCMTYNPTDPSLIYYSSTQTAIRNWCGSLGAHISALLFYFWGSVAYLFLAVLALVTGMFFTKIEYAYHIDRFVGIWLMLVASCLFCNIYSFDFHAGLAGGVLGYYATVALLPMVSTTGAKIFATSMWLSGFIWTTRLSLVDLAKQGLVRCVQALILLLQVTFVGIEKGVYLFASGMTRLGAFAWRVVCAAFEKTETVEQNLDEVGKSSYGQESDTQIEDELEPEIEVRTDAIEHPLTEEYAIKLLANSVLPKDYSSELLKESEQQEPQPVTTDSFQLPMLSLFTSKAAGQQVPSVDQESQERGRKLEEKLKRFGVKGKIKAICPGPVITIYEYQPEIDTKISKIISLEDDLAMALKALSIRIVAPIPGRSVVGFEISNHTRQDVFLEDIMLSPTFSECSRKLPIILGVDSVGKPVVEDLARAPHMLVAGSTGSGKSVGLNAMLFTLLCKMTPSELKLILIDPKRLEFANYADIPHLLFPIVTNPRRAAPILEWVVQEMEDRYDTMARTGVRNVFDYHSWLANNPDKVMSNDESQVDDEQEKYPEMPFIVVMIDELADLMMVAGKQVETHIARVAQMARAAGIHMVVATQRPSVDVLTGVIKVNFPSRIGYRVSSKIDSRTILDTGGAEKLLGRGDMLYMSSGSSELKRVHGAYVSDDQIAALTEHLRGQEVVQYLNVKEAVRTGKAASKEQRADEIYDQVRELIQTKEEISISMLQRHFRIGFNRSARIIEQLENDGLIAPAQGSKPRKVLN